ncbi:hypothetical protein [Micromonospora saelicesensis]|uniref:hypothetical protein n=1 Tax=Micromonospora saelicesensis TaxID=285676 RepID=UPI0011BF0A92|nr:hypothetical protein [Micromonospora saelicesensis]
MPDAFHRFTCQNLRDRSIDHLSLALHPAIRRVMPCLVRGHPAEGDEMSEIVSASETTSARRRPWLGRVGVVGVVAAASLLPALPAHADVYYQVCRPNTLGQVCVSYNWTSRTAAANAQNTTGVTRSITLRLLSQPGGSVLASTTRSVTHNNWVGVPAGNRGYGPYCGVIQDGQAVCLPSTPPPGFPR